MHSTPPHPLHSLTFHLASFSVALPLPLQISNPNGVNPPGGVPSFLHDGFLSTKWTDFSIFPLDSPSAAFQKLTPSVLLIDLGSVKTFSHYQLYTADNLPARDPTSWTLEGLDENSEWVTIDAKVGQPSLERASVSGTMECCGVSQSILKCSDIVCKAPSSPPATRSVLYNYYQAYL